MIIRTVKIENWRGIRAAEYGLQEGVNVLKGPNEAGKSSTVEAIEWALYRDIVGGARLATRDIEAIVPAWDPTARPTVALHLEFSDCTATITKTLAEDSVRRVCRLVVQQDGQADQNFERADAQIRLKILMAGDGLGAARQSAPDAPFLISRQGEGSAYLEAELSESIRSTLTVSNDGAIAPTSRLEQVREEIGRRRARELFDKLRNNAVEAAKKQTDAARLRDELEDLRRRRSESLRIAGSIEQLRADIARLLGEIDDLRPREELSRRGLAENRLLRNAQLAADYELAEARRKHESAVTTRDELGRSVETIARLREAAAREAVDLGRTLAQRTEAQAAQQELQRDYDRAASEVSAVQSRIGAARREVEAWEKWQDVYLSKKEWKQASGRLERVEALEREVEASHRRLNEAPPSPTEAQIAGWRRQWQEIAGQRQRAAQQLQIGLTLHLAQNIEWQADGAPVQSLEASPGVELRLGALQSLVIVLPGIGELNVQCGGRELRQMAGDMERRVTALGDQLAPHGVEVAHLPDGFELLQNRSRERAELVRDLQVRQAQLREEEAAGSSLAALRAEVEECRQRLEAARRACEPLREKFTPDLKQEQAAAALLNARRALEGLEKESEQAQIDLRGAAKRLNEHAAHLGEINAQTRALETGQRDKAQRLDDLTRDALSDEARAADLETGRAAAWEAQKEREIAQQKRDELGAPISQSNIENAEHQAADLALALQSRENDLIRCRSDLGHQCERDPSTELGDIEFNIEARESELERHEARLRGLALLEAALEAERHRLGRALAEPLNLLLSPWLSEIRGKETNVEFDDNGQRITRVRTKDQSGTISLDFAAHSEGMKEQTALIMRLIVAQMAAKRLPSERLPVVLDDPLTQSDTSRRPGLHRVLNEAAQNLQILFVTCHEGHIEGIEAAHHIKLGDLPAAIEPAAAPAAIEPAAEAKPARKPRKKAAATAKEPLNGHDSVPVDTLSLW